MAVKYCALMRQTWYESASRHLTDMERLAFYEACFVYEFTGEIPTEKTCKYSSVLLMFDMVVNDLRSDREKAERIAERNAVNGARGGRPRKFTQVNNDNETQSVFDKTQQNPDGTQSNPIHYTTLHNTTNAASSNSGSGVLDVEFFDAQIWPRLNRSGKFNTRHRVCVAKWSEYSERKRSAISKAVLSDVFAGAENPYYYLEDFAEPQPAYLSGVQCDAEWKAGRSVFVIRTEAGQRYVTGEDVREFDLRPINELKPQE